MSVPQSLQAESIASWRKDFPILDQHIGGKPLVYLDSASSAQQPARVIDAVARYHQEDHANVHRGVHTLSQRATDAYEGARDKIRDFVNAADRAEIVLTSGTTEAINLVAQSFCRPHIQPGGKILVTHLEHHANIVPWQLVCQQTGAELVVAPIDDAGQLVLDELFALLDEDVFLLAIGHVSNALGTVNPVKQIVTEAKKYNIPVLIDGAQGVPHMMIDVRDIGCDFYTFSGHKMFGPTGTGVLYGREALLEAMPPYQGGGDMILEVSFENTLYNELPYKFEAGTPNISGFVGLGAAIEYLQSIGMQRITDYEHKLHGYLVTQLSGLDGIRLVGTANIRAGAQSFLLDDIHSHDLGTILDHQGVAIRTGHHCAMPLMTRFGISGTSRASIALYNNAEDVDRLVAALRKAKEVFA